MTSGAPIMSSQKLGPNCVASRARFCTGALESSDSMLPTTGLVGGRGIGLSLLVDAIVIVSPAFSIRHHEEHLRRSNPSFLRRPMDCFAPLAMTTCCPAPLAEPPSTPFDQLGGDLFRLFLLRPMAAALYQILLEVRHDLLHAVGRGRRKYVIVFGHDHQRRHPHGMIESSRAPPVARHVAVPVDAAGKAGFCEGVDEDLLFLRRQDRRTRIVFGVVASNHLRKRQIEPRRRAVSAAALSLRGTGLRMKASKVCSTRLPNILSGSRPGA